MSKQLIAVLAILLPFCGCTRTQTQDHIPDELLGYWRTDTPRYQGRFLKLDRDYITIGTSDDNLTSVQRVREVRAERNSESTIYTIYSINTEGIESLNLEFEPANGGSLQIRHMGGILWKRGAPPADF